MTVTVNKIYNANLYLDGDKSLIGRASEVTLPEIEVETQEHGGLGMIGKLELPAGLKPLTLTIKWAGFYAEHLRAAANPFAAHMLQARASVETYAAEGRVEEVPVVWHLRASWKKANLGTLKHQEGAEFEDELACTYAKCVVDRRDVFEVDVFNTIWRVGDEDVLATYRRNIGL